MKKEARKKILIATGIFPPQIGGPATYSKLLADKLPARGTGVIVVSFGDVLWLPKILRHTVYFFKVLWYGVGVDVIYAQDPVSVGLPAMIAAKLIRKKFYLKVVGDYAWEQELVESDLRFLSRVIRIWKCTKYSSGRKSKFESLEEFQSKKYGLVTEVRKKVERYVARNAEEVIVPSEYLKRIVMLWGVREEKIKVIYNGFDAPKLSEDKSMLRKKLGISGYTVLSIGRLVPWKGFEALIEMMPALVSQIPDAHLFIVGDGPDKKTLREKIVELRLEDRVSLVGKLPQEKLFEYIKASDVFVLNTSYEGFSHQLLEVMALGTPIVTTPAGGNTEIIKDKTNGILVAHNSLSGFEEAIMFLHKDKEFARTIVAHAKETSATFGDERMLDATVQELSLI